MGPKIMNPQRLLRWGAGLTLAAFFLWYYLPCGLAILYNYWWWIIYSGSVQLAVPSAVVHASQYEVPKILHQTWKDKEVPDRWKAAQQSCIAAHPGYEYRLWTDADAEKLIATKFPWFLETYLSYPHSIQRADVMRYFVLYEYGGIYLDLDVHCLKSLDYLRHYNFTAPKTYPIGVSNDVMVARPHDAFSELLIKNLASWKKWFFVKYATVMFSTGPMFVTIMFSRYKQKQDFSVLPADVYGKYEVTPNAYLKHLHGSSWHGDDAKYVFWLEHHGLSTAALAALLLVGAAAGWFVYKRYIGHRSAANPNLQLAHIFVDAGGGMVAGSGVVLGDKGLTALKGGSSSSSSSFQDATATARVVAVTASNSIQQMLCNLGFRGQSASKQKIDTP